MRKKISKLILQSMFIPAFFVFASTVHAATYYVDQTGGADSNDGLSIQSAWQTISKVNGTTLMPGDNVLLKSGESWNEALIVPSSGTYANPITFGSYGNGNKPLITGLKTLSGWTSVGGGIYKASCTTCGSTLNMVTLNGVEQGMGRYPNANAANSGYLTIQSHTNTTITDSSLPASPNWTGAEVVIRKNHWIIDRHSITSHSGTTITFSSNSIYAPINGYGYFIQNSINTLDQMGEWYYNPSTKEVNVYFGASDPSTYIVKVSTIDALATSTNKSNIIFNGIAFEGANKAAINISGGQNITITNDAFALSGTNAIAGINSPGTIIRDSTFDYTNNNAIALLTASDSIVHGVTIDHTGTFPGLGVNGDGNLIGISIGGGSNNIIENSIVNNTGGDPVTFQGDMTVQNNFINTFAFVKDDVGGIHIGDPANNIFFSRTRKILNNIIIGGQEARNGTDQSRYSDPNALWTANGIYLDDNIYNVEISGNVTANNNGSGIFVHDAYNLNIHDNVSVNNHTPLAMLQDDPNPGADIRMQVRGVVSANNILGLTSTDRVMDFRTNSVTDDIGQFGTFDTNSYIHPSGNTVALTYVNNGAPQSRTFTQWQSTYNKDLTSQDIVATAIRLEYNPTSTSSVVSLGGQQYVDVNNNLYTGSVSLAPYGEMVLLSPGTFGVTAPKAPTALSGIASDGTATLSWTAPSSNNGAVITDYLVEYKKSSDSTWLPFADGTSVATTAVVTGLTNNVAYDFRISAVNSAGTSTPSDTTSLTPGGVAGVPTDLVATPGDRQVSLSFTAPVSNGGSAITGYAITATPGAISFTATQTPAVVTGLTNGIAYTFSVAAINSSGTGAAVTIGATPAAVSSGGGGGGGSSSSPSGATSTITTTTPPVVTPPTIETPSSDCINGALYSASTGKKCPSTSVVDTPSSTLFIHDLSMGSKGVDVQRLQKYLNAHGFVVAPSGAGSPGKETTTFGAATKAALMKYQLVYKKEILIPSGLKKPTGIFGPSTRKWINSMI